MSRKLKPAPVNPTPEYLDVPPMKLTVLIERNLENGRLSACVIGSGPNPQRGSNLIRSNVKNVDTAISTADKRLREEFRLLELDITFQGPSGEEKGPQ